jgi:bifunctional non-homologous end joining protein LigD
LKTTSEILGKEWSGREHSNPILYAFDLLWLNGEDLRQQPLIVRKKRLATMIRTAHRSRIIFAQHIDGRGKRFFQEICKMDLEGVVAKRKLSVYKDNGAGWLKIKNRNYSQAEGRHELLTRRASNAQNSLSRTTH